MGRALKVVLEAVAGLAVLAAAVFVFLNFKKQDAPAQGPGRAGGAVPVAVAVAEERLTSDRLEALGTGRARESVLVTASESERVVALHFEDGEFVEAGKLLAQLDDAVLRREREIAVAALEEEEREMARARDLLGREGIARKLVEGRETSLAKARLALEMVDTRLALREIRAPFGGLLGFRRVSVGAYVTPGTVLTTLDDISEIHIDFSVPEKHWAALGTGVVFHAQTASLPGVALQGRVTSVETRIDPASLSATARGTLGNTDGRLRPGMLFTVRVEASPRRAVWVPEKALTSLGERQFVFVPRDGTAQRREVKLGRREAGGVEVAAGLAAGEFVVTDGVGRLSRDGMAIQVTGNTEQKTSRENAAKGDSE